MNRTLQLAVVLLVGIAIGHFGFSTKLNAQIRSNQATHLLTTDLSGWCDGKEVTVDLLEAGVGTSGRHYHPAHSFTWILEGSEAYTVDGQPTKVVKSGDLLHEAPMQVHTNENQSPVKLLVLRIIEKGKDATVRLQ